MARKITQGDPPKTKATRQDSLDVMNNSQAIAEFFKNYDLTQNYEIEGTSLWEELEVALKSSDEEQDWGEYSTKENGISKDRKISRDEYYQKIDENKFYQRETANSIVDVSSPFPLYDRRITPQALNLYINSINGSPMKGDIVVSPQYDPLAVAPWSPLSDEDKKARIQRYGISGTPYSSLGDVPSIYVSTPSTPSTSPATATKNITTLYPPRPAAPEKMQSLGVGTSQELNMSPHMKVPNAAGRAVSTSTGHRFSKLVDDPPYKKDAAGNTLRRQVYDSQYDPRLMKTQEANKYSQATFEKGGFLQALMPLIGAGIGTAIVPGAGTMMGLQLGSAGGNMLGQFEMGGSLNALQGPQHSQVNPKTGEFGIPMDRQGNNTDAANAVASAEGGETVLDNEYIFSDKLKNPETGNTFAEDSKKLISNPKDDNITIKTKKMLRKQLQEKQEASKQGELQKGIEKFQKKYGGYLPDGNELKIGKTQFGGATNFGGSPQYDMGGYMDNPWEPVRTDGPRNRSGENMMFMPQRNQNFMGALSTLKGLPTPTMPNFTRDINNTGTLLDALKNESITNTNDLLNNLKSAPGTNTGDLLEKLKSAPGTANPNPGLSLGQGAAAMAPYAGSIFNMLQGLSRNEKTTPQMNLQLGNMNDKYKQALDYNIDDKKRNILNTRNLLTDSIRNNSGGSRGGLFNQQMAANNNMDYGLERILSEQSRYQGGVNMNWANSLRGVGEYDRASRTAAFDSDMQTKANSRNMVGESLSQASNIYQQQKNDQIRMDILREMYGQYGPMMNLLFPNSNPDA
jgi:hypothetical protein